MGTFGHYWVPYGVYTTQTNSNISGPFIYCHKQKLFLNRHPTLLSMFLVRSMTWTESEWNLSVWSCRYVLNKSPNWPSLSKSRFLKRKGYLCFQWSYSCICKNREFFEGLCSKSRSSEDIDGTLHLILLSYRKLFFQQIRDFVLLKYTPQFSTVMTSLYLRSQNAEF